ncbi:hypothetical protein LTR86_003138 [Recurvomyces mirabilis]|nr:hypothetical protein LTR86_003138 [Recurvomyces mirabilis]
MDTDSRGRLDCTDILSFEMHLNAVRFLVGLAESGFYPGMQYVIGSWYRGDELAKRSCIFHCAGAIATMYSGYLMAVVYHLGGHGGLRGWQWLFIVDGVISLPIAISGYFLLPDFPENTRAFYFTAEERALGRKRMELEGRKPRAPYTSAKVKRIFSSWHIYLMALMYITFNNNAGSIPTFGESLLDTLRGQYLKASKEPKYAIWQINVYPTATYGVQVITTLAYAWTSDSVFRQQRWPAIIIGGIVNIICTVSLAVWDIPVGWKWACFIMMGAGFGLSGMIMAWAHEVCTKDNEERALVIATMNEMAYVVQAWLPLIVWQQVDAPRYHKGYITVTCLSLVMILTALLVRQLHNRERKQDALAHELEHSDSEGSSPPVEIGVEVDSGKK